MRSLQREMLFGDALKAANYWADKPVKKWAVDVTAGPYNRPTYRRTIYVSARTSAGAISCAKANFFSFNKPSRPRFAARLAGPDELGCKPAPPTPAQPFAAHTSR